MPELALLDAALAASMSSSTRPSNQTAAAGTHPAAARAARAGTGRSRNYADGGHITVADLGDGLIHRTLVLGGLTNEYSRAA